jgi:hypothetical protein
MGIYICTHARTHARTRESSWYPNFSTLKHDQLQYDRPSHPEEGGALLKMLFHFLKLFFFRLRMNELAKLEFSLSRRMSVFLRRVMSVCPLCQHRIKSIRVKFCFVTTLRRFKNAVWWRLAGQTLPSSYSTWKFITVFIKAVHWTLCCTSESLPHPRNIFAEV